MTLVLESGIFLTMGLQAFGIVEETAAFSGGLAFAAFLAVTLGALIMVIRAVFIALMFTWLDHRHKRRQRRYEAEAARIERFEKRMHKASEVDADMLQARDLSPERWEDALNHYRRRLKRRARRNAMRGSDLDYFESEPLGPREGSVIVWAGMRGAITLAAAQTISTHAPMRAFLLTIALFIAAGALVIQGLTLPGLIRIVKPKMATGDISEEERAKLLKVMGSALVDTALAQAIHEVDGQTLLSAGVSRTLSRIGHAVSVEDEAASARIARTADRVLTDILQDGTPPDAASASETDDDGHGTVDRARRRLSAPSRATRSVNSLWRPSTPSATPSCRPATRESSPRRPWKAPSPDSTTRKSCWSPATASTTDRRCGVNRARSARQSVVTREAYAGSSVTELSASSRRCGLTIPSRARTR